MNGSGAPPLHTSQVLLLLLLLLVVVCGCYNTGIDTPQ
jgi:hypothetical protein